MASRFWVGGTGNWDLADTTHWAATSGGAGGATVPTGTDDVAFDGSSNATAYTVTVTGLVLCQNLTFAAPAAGNVTWAGTTASSIFGNLTLYAGLIRTYSGVINMNATAAGKTITTAGVSLISITFNGTGGGWILQDALSCPTGNLALIAGTLDTNGKAVSCVAFHDAATGTAVRVLTLGASVITMSGVWSFPVASNFTLNAGTSVINMSSTAFVDGVSGHTYATVNLTGVAAVALTGTLTFGTLTRTNASGYASMTLSGNITVTGTFTCTGSNASTQRMYLCSSAVGTPRTVTAAVCVLSNVDFEDIVGAGAGTWSGTLLGNCGGNTGITFATPLTAYWVHDATASRTFTDAMWFTASGGAVATRYPLPQDNAIFDALSFNASGRTLSIGISGIRLPSLNWTGTTNTPTINWNFGCFIYGSLTLVPGMTVANSSSVTFRGRGSSTVTLAGKSLPPVNVWLTSAGSLVAQDAFATSFSFSMTSGTFNDGGNAVSIGTVFNLANGSVVASGPWAVTGGTGVVWTVSGTLVSAPSTITLSDPTSATKQFQGGGRTYNNLTFTGGGSGFFDVTGSNTFLGTVALGAQSVRFTAGTTTTLAGLTAAGATISSVTAANHSLVKTGIGMVNVTGTTISWSQASPATRFYASLASIDAGNNSGWVFNGGYMASKGKVAVTTGGTPVQVSAVNAPASRITFQQISGNTGKMWICDRAAAVKATYVGIEFVLPSPGASPAGLLHSYTIETQGSNGLNLLNYWLDADVNGEGVVISYTQV